jgi:hypothetical protein
LARLDKNKPTIVEVVFIGKSENQIEGYGRDNPPPDEKSPEDKSLESALEDALALWQHPTIALNYSWI